MPSHDQPNRAITADLWVIRTPLSLLDLHEEPISAGLKDAIPVTHFVLQNIVVRRIGRIALSSRLNRISGLAQSDVSVIA